MKILFISKYASGVEFGKPSRQYLYANQLAKMGHEVRLVYSRSNGKNNNPKFKGYYKSINEKNIEKIVLNGPLINVGFNLERIWSWLLFEINNFRYYRKVKEWEPDVVLVSSLSILTFVYGVFLKRKLKIPLIIEVRDLYPLTLIEVGGLSKRNPFIWFLKQIEIFGYKDADLIVSTLENTESYFYDTAKKDINFFWLPMGFSEETYSSVPSPQVVEIIDSINNLKSQNKFIVAYAGTIGRANALDGLMKLTEDKEVSKNNVHFVFLGEGPLKMKYQEDFRNDSSTFFPAVEKTFVPEILKHCDILVNTWLDIPIYRFGISPNKWIEYMYAGRPILLALNAYSKIFNKANCGWQIPAQDYEELKLAILRAKHEEPEKLNQLGMNGKNYLMENLTYEILTKGFNKRIEEIVKAKL